MATNSKSNRGFSLVPGIGKNTDQAAMLQALQAASIPGAVGFAAALPVITPDYPGVANLIIGSSYNVPIGDCQQSDSNARVFYVTEEVEKTAASLKERGQMVPALGYVDGDKVTLLDGQKRLRALSIAGLGKLTVWITKKPATPIDAYETSWTANKERSEQSPLSDAVRWKSFLEQGLYKSQDEIASRLNLSKAAVSQIIGIARIPDDLLRRMHTIETTRESSTIAYEISCLFKDFKPEGEGAEATLAIATEVLDKIQKDDLTRSQVKQLIDKLVQGKRTRVHPATAEFAYGKGKAIVKAFPSRGQVDLSVRGLSAEEVEKLSNRVQEWLKADGKRKD